MSPGDVLEYGALPLLEALAGAEAPPAVIAAALGLLCEDDKKSTKRKRLCSLM